MDVIQKNITSNAKGIFLPDQSRLKKFTIPKRAPDKGLLTECSNNQRDCNEIKQRLSQSCLDKECNLESLWQFSKMKMVHNKDLEEEFVAKRTKLREAGRQDKETSSFLLVSNKEVSNICQSGLHTGHSKKEQQNIMKQLGNPQFGIYLFRHIDVALNYASEHSIPIENIIIFRVLLGKVKKIQPPKGKKKVALDPTPNFDCHMSRMHPSVKDSLEDQAIGSLIYFYEYNEHSKPVDKPRQCLPYAVIEVKCINQKNATVSASTSSQCRPQKLPKHVGRRLPLGNCTRVTRIGKSQLIYEHFRKPMIGCAVNSENNASPSFSGGLQNWNSSIVQTQNKPKSTGRWDSTHTETNEINLHCSPDPDVSRNVRSAHIENSNKNPLKTHPEVPPACDSSSSTVITSKLIKDPRLTKREKVLGKQNGEAILDGISQCENELDYNLEMKVSAALSMPYPVTENFLLNSKNAVGQKQYMEKTSWEENLEGTILPSVLNRNKDSPVNGEQRLSNVKKNILGSQNTNTDHCLKTYVGDSSLRSKVCKTNNSNRTLMEYVKGEKGTRHSKLPSLHLNPSKTLINEWKFPDQNPESAAFGNHKMDNRGEMESQLQEDYAYISEMHCSTNLDTKCAQNNFTSSEEEHNDNANSCSLHDYTLQSEVCKKLHISEKVMGEVWDEDLSEQSTENQMDAENFEQNVCHAVIEFEKFNKIEAPVMINKQIYTACEVANSSVGEKEESTIEKVKDNSIIERIMHQSPASCGSDTVLRNFNGKCVCFPESVSLDKNTFGDSKECLLSSGIFVDEQRNYKTNNTANTNDFDQICTSELEEKGKRYIPTLQVPSSTESSAKETSEKEDSVKEDGISDIKCCMETSMNPEILDSESSGSDFNFSGQGRGSTTEAKLIKRNNRKEKCESLHDQAFLTKGTDMVTCQEKDCTASVRSTSVPVPLENIKYTKFKNAQSHSEISGLSNANFEELNNNSSCEDDCLEVFEQDLEVKCNDQNLNIIGDFENTLGECKKCISTSQKPCKHENYLEKMDEYHFLQKRIDWDNLLGNPSQNTKVSGNPSVEENKNDLEEKPELFVCPDLQITITNIIQPKLNSPHSSSRMKTDMGKCSGHKMDIKWLQEKNAKHHRRKEQNNSDEKYVFSSMSKGQVETFVQSEEYIKNVLNTLNTQALLCKNKHLSQKIDGAMFHLRKAHRRVQKSLKILSKAGRKKSSESSKSCEVLQCVSSSNCVSDMPCSCDNARNAKLTKLHTVSEKSSLDTMELKSTKPSGDKHIMSNEQKIHLNVISGYKTQENINTSMVSTEHDISSEVNRCTSKDSAKHLNTAVEKKESCVNREDKRKDERTCDSDIKASAIKFAIPVQAALESSAKVNILKADNISIMLENVFSDENKALGIAPAPQIKISLSAKASSNDYELSPVSLENNCFSNEPFNNCRDLSHDIKHPEVGFEQKSLDFIIRISEILRKADEATSLNVLLEQVIFCRSVLPSFVRAFEKKQGCSFEHVLVSREILESTERRVQAINKLKPSAIESLIELQIIMETIEFIENKKRLLEGVPTFRSLLWYDDSLCRELFGGQSGYQQQSNFYPAFQRRLEYNALDELQTHHKQLVDAFNNTSWEHNSYYSFLKLRREIEECEQAMKSNSNFSDFFLSVPYVCGANFGDTLDDLEHARKNTVDLINRSQTPGINLRAEKEEHLWFIMEIIVTKVEFIKTCEDVNIKASLFGLEHIFFDAAKSLAWTERVKFINGDFKGEERQSIKINEADLSKLYETYQLMIEEFGRRNLNSAIEEQTFKKSSVDSCNCEMAGKQQEANYCITKSLIVHQDIGFIGEILGEAQSSDTERLQQLVCRCTEHMEMLKQYFQILQEESDSVLITKENVLGFLKSGGINPVILKPEAVEVYAEMTMVHETVLFLENSIARRVDKPRFRSLLWFDTSLVPELFRCQEKMASFSYRKGNLIEIIDSSISELKGEWDAIHGYAGNLNWSYALHLLKREFEELSETRNLLQTSKSFSSMCVNLVPYTISLNYGSTVSELECNYNQFSSLLDKLMMCERKDIGKMAHIMKIMKTIEHMKFVCSKQEKSPLPLVIYQMVKNWRKSCQLKRQGLDTAEGHSPKHSMCSSGLPASQASDYQSQHKRPASITSEDCSSSFEEMSDPSPTKKIKIADSLKTTKEKINEEETCRILRVSGKYNFPKDKELQLSISTDNMWNKKPGSLRETAPISPSQLKDLKAAYPFESIQSSPKVSETKFLFSNTLVGQQNLADLKDFNESSWNAKDHDQEYIASHNEGGESLSLPSVTVELLQQSPENSPTRDAANSVLGMLNEHHNLKSDVLGNASHLMPECSTALSSPLKSDRNEGKCGQEKNATPNCTTTYNLDSTVMTELNKATELEHLQMEPSYSENNKTKFSPLNQNEETEETSQLQSSPVHIYGAVYPYYSWYLYQNHCNTHSVTQTYQELNSCEMHPLTPGMSTTTSMVYNTESSMFCSQTLSHFSVGESQRFNLAQTYPMYGYVSSAMAFPYSNWQQPLWYTENQPWAQVAFPYPSNNGSEDYVALQ
nr:testis-expressed protein 15 [Zootoca vivipara]